MKTKSSVIHLEKSSILLKETGETYPRSQLLLALNHANSYNDKKNFTNSATLSLKPGVYNLTSAVVIRSDVIIEGDSAVIAVDTNSGFVVEGGCLQLIDTKISLRSSNEIQVIPIKVNKKAKLLMRGSGIEAIDDVKEPILGILNEGVADAMNCVFNNSTITSNNDLKLKNSSFVGKWNEKDSFCIMARGSLTVHDCSFENVSQGIYVIESKIEVTNTKFDTQNTCLFLQDNTEALIKNCELMTNHGTALKVRKANVKMNETVVCGKKDNDEAETIGLEIENSVVDITDVTINDVNKGACFAKGELAFNGIHVEDCVDGFEINDTKVTGKSLQLRTINNLGMKIIKSSTPVELTGVMIIGAQTGVSVIESEEIQIYDIKIKNVESGIQLNDSTCTIKKAILNFLNSKNSSSSGIIVHYSNSVDVEKRIVLDECKVQGAMCGISVIGEENDNVYTIRKFEQKTSLLNCSFIKCEIGFSSENSKGSLLGCTFVMSKELAIYFNKESSYKLRWINYIEPTERFSNDLELLKVSTEERAFIGGTSDLVTLNFSILRERLRQGKNLVSYGNAKEISIILKSIQHMLILQKKATSELMYNLMLEDLALGVFASIFTLDQDDGKAETLFQLTELVSLFADVKRIESFDEALDVLKDIFEQGLMRTEDYDNLVNRLDNSQKDCLRRANYIRKRAYVMNAARTNSVLGWYWMQILKEREDDKKIRKEVLYYLAGSKNSTLKYHIDWVSGWAVEFLGKEFINLDIPRDEEDLKLSVAWAEYLLENSDPAPILDAISKNKGNYTTFDCNHRDTVLLFEATNMFALLSGPGGQQISSEKKRHEALSSAFILFCGKGVLPGFLRRIAAQATTPVEIFVHFSDLFDKNKNIISERHINTLLAVIHELYYPEPLKSPTSNTLLIGRTICALCQRKMKPIDTIKIQHCPETHRVCKECFTSSLSDPCAKIGLCPVMIDADKRKQCKALATRRDMELCGLDIKKIYEILETRIRRNLLKIEGWAECLNPVINCFAGCPNGIQRDRVFFYCILCNYYNEF